jgi:hypothetical protein
MSVVAHACHPSNVRKQKIGGLRSRLAWAKNKTLSSKYPEQKRAGRYSVRSRIAASEALSPEFKLQYCQNQTNKDKKQKQPLLKMKI